MSVVLVGQGALMLWSGAQLFPGGAQCFHEQGIKKADSSSAPVGTMLNGSIDL